MPSNVQNTYHVKLDATTASLQTAQIDTLVDSNKNIGNSSQYLRSTNDGRVYWSPLGSGVPGIVGATGATGPIGATGSIGPVGATGIIGVQGTQGATGPIGPDGVRGPRGATGPAFLIGATGPNGEIGGITFDYFYETGGSTTLASGKASSINDLSSGMTLTSIYVHETDQDSIAAGNFYTTNATKSGYIMIQPKTATTTDSDFIMLEYSNITGPVNNVYAINGVIVLQNTLINPIANGEEITLQFVIYGTIGATGATGPPINVSGATDAILLSDGNGGVVAATKSFIDVTTGQFTVHGNSDPTQSNLITLATDQNGFGVLSSSKTGSGTTGDLIVRVGSNTTGVGNECIRVNTNHDTLFLDNVNPSSSTQYSEKIQTRATSSSGASMSLNCYDPASTSGSLNTSRLTFRKIITNNIDDHNSLDTPDGVGLGYIDFKGVISGTDTRLSMIRSFVDDTTGGNISFATQKAGGTFTEKMIIKNDGKVGIGAGHTPSKTLDVNGSFNTTGSSTLNNWFKCESLSKQVSASQTAIVDINAGTGRGFVKVYISVSFVGSGTSNALFDYELLTVDTQTLGGGTNIRETHNGSTGSFQVSTTDFSVTRPSAGVIRITYTNQSSGTNSIQFYISGKFDNGSTIT